MGKLELYGLVGALSFIALAGAHWTGRLVAAKNCEAQKAASAGEAIDEKNEDDATQGKAGSSSDDALRAQIERLTRKLEKADVPTGLACDAPGSGDSVHDAYDQIFEEGVPSGR